MDPPTPEVRVDPPSPLMQPLGSAGAQARAGLLPDPTDDDEEVKTVMREFPSNISDAARAAIAGFTSMGGPTDPLRGPSGSPSPGAVFAPRAIGGATGDLPAAPRPAAGRRPLNQTAPMPVLFSPPRPGAAAELASPSGPRDTVDDDDDVSDLQATVMREMPALPPEVARRLDAALGGPAQSARPMWPAGQHAGTPQRVAPGMQPGPGGTLDLPPPPPPGSSHGRPVGAGPMQTGPMAIAGAPPHGVSGSPTAPSPPMAYGAPYSQTPPSNPLPTQGMPSWNSGHTAPLQPVPPLPGVNTPLPSGYGATPGGFAPGDLNAPSRPGFPSPALGGGVQPGSQGGWMQAPPPPGTPTFDNDRIGSDPFRQRGRGTTIAAVFALLLAAVVTFAVVRYLL
jgi:hypothetical protein